MTNNYFKFWLLTTALILNFQPIIAQLVTAPIPTTKNKTIRSNARTGEGVAPLTLPFWDDFSFTQNVPDDSLWADAENVFIGNGFGDDAPSINIATFDGLLSNGSPHSQSDSFGLRDSLKSCPIDLSSFTTSSDVYLSFFYQYGGNGDAPELSDNLFLDFLNTDSEWVRVWPTETKPLNRDGQWHQILIKADDASYFHDAFQFKISNEGRQSGPWDVWNVDYVYMNDGRDEGDIFYPDRAARDISSFKGYRAIPFRHFNGIFERDSVDVFNHAITGSGLRNIDHIYTAKINYFQENVSIGDTTLSHDANTNEEVDAQKNKFIELHNILKDEVINEETLITTYKGLAADSVVLDLTIALETSDNLLPATGENFDYDLKYAPIDFRSNDTIRTQFVIGDYYAYDDGGAEFGIGFTVPGQQLAYKYGLTKKPDTEFKLAGFDIYFPYVGSDPTNKQIILKVWRILDQPAIIERTISIQREEGLNKFSRYKLRKPIDISDSFYIGYEQLSSDVWVGVDRNNNTMDSVSIDLGAGWEPVNSNQKGSLMLRPFFDPDAEGVPTSIDKLIERNVKIYPNPTKDIVTVKGDFDRASLYNAQGALISTQEGLNGDAEINLASNPSGIYILRLFNKNQSFARKIIKD